MVRRHSYTAEASCFSMAPSPVALGGGEMVGKRSVPAFKPLGLFANLGSLRMVICYSHLIFRSN